MTKPLDRTGTWRTYSMADGLAGVRIEHIAEDSAGYLFSTIWRTKGLQIVQCIYEDREGRIWCGGHRTLGYYDGTSFHDLMPLYLQHYDQPPAPYSPNQCRGIAQDREGHMWFGFKNLIRFNGTSFYRYKEKDGIPPGYSVSGTVGLPKNKKARQSVVDRRAFVCPGGE